MESHQKVILSNSSDVAQPVKPKPKSLSANFGQTASDGQRKEGIEGNSEGFVGVLEVFIHQARDIHNICIYHKQDVYAKICLTSDPEATVSTQTINGGGQNPVFNENLRLNVRTVDSLLRCEIWMLSRVRNYLEDQLLGFALVPLSDVLVENGKLAREFEMSSSDLFHSPSGFVKLTLTYTGASPEVLAIPAPPSSLPVSARNRDSEERDSIPCELNKIEFPDPVVANENEMMVTEYFSIPCPEEDSQSLESCETTGKDNHHSSNVSSHALENIAKESCKVEIPPSSDSTENSPSVNASTVSQPFSDAVGGSKSTSEDVFPSLEKKKEDVEEAESGVSTFAKPVITINVEQEQKVVQQDIVDMYMKSMKQFTEALAKMKLPLDIENGTADSGKTDSDGRVQASKGEGPSPKVFYGSRAFF